MVIDTCVCSKCFIMRHVVAENEFNMVSVEYKEATIMLNCCKISTPQSYKTPHNTISSIKGMEA